MLASPGSRDRRPCPRCRKPTIHVRDEGTGGSGWVCSRCMHYTADPGPDPRPVVIGIAVGLLLLVGAVKVILVAFDR